MAERIQLSPEEIQARRDESDRTNYKAWETWRDKFRKERDDFHEAGGLPESSFNISDVLDELLKVKAPAEILSALTRELEHDRLFHTSYVEFIHLMRARGLLDSQQEKDYLNAGVATIQTQKLAQEVVSPSNTTSADALDPVIAEALRNM